MVVRELGYGRCLVEDYWWNEGWKGVGWAVDEQETSFEGLVSLVTQNRRGAAQTWPGSVVGWMRVNEGNGDSERPMLASMSRL